MAQIPCFVVSLATATQRREAMMNLLASHGITPRWFDAVDGRVMSAEELAKHFAAELATQVYGPMSRSEIGCALSHLGIYRLMVEQGIASAVIFEDDIDLAPDFAALLDTQSGLLGMFSTDDPAMVQLTHVRRGYRFGARSVGNYHIVRPHGGVWRTSGYFITLAAAQKMLSGAYPVCVAADYWRYFEQQRFLTLYALTPNAVWDGPLSKSSSISEGRVPRRRLRRRIGYAVKRLWQSVVVRRLLVKKLPERISDDAHG
ncbi:glycosyltransferase family 25 protein [Alcaligenaceae bacterium LF4-65]|uniref:Glycosyltransferase family 25 protein n=1 Tax=Zwartia hollandica TaxID=324606 RepID=A0A953T269_9BURK|nr:glycosyltransferase family 25 protein [Zwartia hollandica]MBZ1350060.1 glycosyltransferase family 25 protein [Zwartia hollandica]